MGTSQLDDALMLLRNSLGDVRFPMSLPDSKDASAAARDMVTQLDDYVLPRLASLDAPLLAVIGGSTGAGKSTLVNSLVGRVVSRPGVIRPTTRSPVLVHHPDDVSYFQSDRILPGLGRTTQQTNDVSTLQLVAEPSLPRGLAILDAPDVDSVVKENRVLAAQLLSAADLWLFVTSAARYADAVPWEYLNQAAERTAAVAVVLDRIPPAAMTEVPAHLGRLMTERGLGDSPLFAVPETTVDQEGLLPDSAVAPIRDWLAALAADQASRQAVVMQTLDGAINALATRSPQVAAAAESQQDTLNLLWTDAEKSYHEAVRAISIQTADGTLLRGEVLARWHDFVGTGEFMRAVEQKIGWVRDRIMRALRGQPRQTADVEMAVQSGMETLVIEEGEAAAERVESAWMAHPAGRALLAKTKIDLSKASDTYAADVARTIRDWQGDVLELVSSEGSSKRVGARVMAIGVNAIGVALMIVVFVNTGGLSGGEIGVAGGTALVAQRFLEAIFGDDAVRKLAKTAKDALDGRIEALLATELVRYRKVLDDLKLPDDQAQVIRDAVKTVLDVRDGKAVELPTSTDRPAIESGEVVSGDIIDPVDPDQGQRWGAHDG